MRECDEMGDGCISDRCGLVCEKYLNLRCDLCGDGFSEIDGMGGFCSDCGELGGFCLGGSGGLCGGCLGLCWKW